MITAIEKKSYVLTIPNEKDKCAVNVKMTEAGIQVMLECGEKGITFMADVFMVYPKQN